MVGDFNGEMANVNALCKEYDLHPVIKDGEATHEKGNQLDQCFTNIGGARHNMIEVDMTDHKAVELHFNFIQRERDVDIRNIPSKIS